MAARERIDDFEKFFINSDTEKVQNDPWSVLADETNIPKLIGIQTDPLHHKINSEKYLESLEKKLARLKGKTNKEGKASEMITSLQRTKENQLNQILAGKSQLNMCDDDEIDYQDTTVMSSLQRKINPEGQAINPVELYPLVNNDFLAKASEIDDTDKTDSGITKLEKVSSKAPS